LPDSKETRVFFRIPNYQTSPVASTGISNREAGRERTEAFLEGAEALFVDVAQKALATAHLAGSDIDTVVTVCPPASQRQVSKPVLLA